MFRSSHFWFLVTFGNEVTKIRKYYKIFFLHYARQVGHEGEKRKENHATKVTKIPKPKDKNR